MCNIGLWLQYHRVLGSKLRNQKSYGNQKSYETLPLIQRQLRAKSRLEQPQDFKKRDQNDVKFVCEFNKRIYRPKKAAEN